MARMHSRKRGKSGSTRPENRVKPSWVELKDKEVEMLITKLAKEGHSASQIGLRLRDNYGIPDAKVITGKTITKTLADNKLLPQLPEDISALIKKSINLRKHLEANHKDQFAKRGITLTDSKVKRLAKYYKKTGRLPEDWKYDPRNIRLHIE